MNSYLKDRFILDATVVKYEMQCGVPQGSVIGPLLWNLMYDEVLRIPLPNNVRRIAYADGLALVGIAKTETGWRG